MVYEWMASGNIVQYVRHNAGNHLKLVGHNGIFLRFLLRTPQLTDAAEGLTYIHDTNIIHGDLKGVSLLIGIPRTPLTLFRQIS